MRLALFTFLAFTTVAVAKNTPTSQTAPSHEIDDEEEEVAMEEILPTSQTAAKAIDVKSYKTSTLFTTPSIIANANRFRTAVYNGNVYVVYASQGDASGFKSRRMMVAKIPLNGSGAVTHTLVGGTDPAVRGYHISGNNHKIWDVAVDRAGYIHVTGDMHTRDKMGYWRSDKPEDISSFTEIEWEDKPHGTPLRCPISQNTTFPFFWKDRKGQLFWSAMQSSSFLPFCSYDETTKLWTPLGGPGAKGGNIRLAWTSGGTRNVSNPKSKFSSSHFTPVWDSSNRLHMVIGMLDTTFCGAHPVPVGSHILYAYSDDGGKTAHRADGTLIQYPIRASSGSSANRGDIILEEMKDDPKHNWLNPGASLSLDKDDRPMISVESYSTGKHYFRLESGKWVEHPGGKGLEARSPDPKQIIDALHLPVMKHGYDKNYFRDTGELVWVSVEGSRDKATYTIHRTVFNGVKK